MKIIHRSFLAAAGFLFAACAGPSRLVSSSPGIVVAPSTSETPYVEALPSGFTMPRRAAARPWKDCNSRLQFFASRQELDELEHDFEVAPTAVAEDTERKRIGFRGIFGPDPVAGYIQIFGEQFDDPLLPAEFDNFVVGGGVIGAPEIGKGGPIQMILPFRAGFSLAAGLEEVAGFDEELVYLDVELEFGFGIRVHGVQPSFGFLVDNFYGLHDSDNPASPAFDDPAIISESNVAGFAEVLFKPARAPVFGRLRGTFGQVPGIEFGFGFGF